MTQTQTIRIFYARNISLKSFIKVNSRARHWNFFNGKKTYPKVVAHPFCCFVDNSEISWEIRIGIFLGSWELIQTGLCFGQNPAPSISSQGMKEVRSKELFGASEKFRAWVSITIGNNPISILSAIFFDRLCLRVAVWIFYYICANTMSDVGQVKET